MRDPANRDPGEASPHCEASPHRPERPRPRVRDRDVYAVAAAVVVLVLAANLVSAAVRPLDRVLAFAPVIVVVLVTVTVLVLVRSIGRGSGPD
jgi:hypothetical protein